MSRGVMSVACPTGRVGRGPVPAGTGSASRATAVAPSWSGDPLPQLSCLRRGARAFLDRPAPGGLPRRVDPELDPHRRRDPTTGRRGGRPGSARDGLGVVIFRLGAEWLAIRAQVVVEVTGPARHRIPHRTNAVVAGLANLRGQLHLCASLHGLLGAVRRPRRPLRPRRGFPRMIVIRKGTSRGSSRLDEVLGVAAIPPGAATHRSSTLANPTVSFSQAVFERTGPKRRPARRGAASSTR